jgi:integrase
MRRYRLQRGIHPPEWPKSELDRLDAAFGRKGRIHKKGPANGWSPNTNRGVWSPYALALGWQHDRGILDWALSPAARWPEAVLEQYDAHLAATYAKGTHRKRLSGLERAISVLEVTADRRLLLSTINRLGKVHPSADKELRAVSSIDLEDLGDELMDKAEAGKHRSPRLAAALFRTGLAIGLMADMINRLGEFTQLQIGDHILKENGLWYMKAAKPNSSTKRQPRKRPIPVRWARRLDRYVSVYREMLCCDRKGVVRYVGTALWVSTRCRAQSENSIRDNICKFTEQKFDQPINPHAFRYSMVTTVAIHAPEKMHAVQVVAGHSPGSRTTTENYDKASSYSASMDWNAIAVEIRKRGIDKRLLRRKSTPRR